MKNNAQQEVEQKIAQLEKHLNTMSEATRTYFDNKLRMRKNIRKDLTNNVHYKTSKDTIVAVAGFKRFHQTDANGRNADIWGIDLVADVAKLEAEGRVMPQYLDVKEDGREAHFAHVNADSKDHYQYFDAEDAKKILGNAFDYDEYGRPAYTKNYTIAQETKDDSLLSIRYVSDDEISKKHESIGKDMKNVPYDTDIKLFDLDKDGKFKVADGQAKIDSNSSFVLTKYPEFQRETETKESALTTPSRIDEYTGPRQPMQGRYVMPTFSADVSLDRHNFMSVNLDSIKVTSENTLKSRDFGEGHQLGTQLEHDFRLSMEDLNNYADNYVKDKAKFKDELSDAKLLNDMNKANKQLTDLRDVSLNDIRNFANENDVDLSDKMFDSVYKDFAYHSKGLLAHDKSVIHQNTMAGKQVALAVESMKAVHYVDKDGNKQSAAVVTAFKRGDVDSQNNKFDGDYVVNSETKDHREVHGQIVSDETAKKILAVNGYDDVKSEDYSKISDKQTLVFDANVFSPRHGFYNDFRFNPKPDLINESELAFDSDRDMHRLIEKRVEASNYDVDTELEP